MKQSKASALIFLIFINLWGIIIPVIYSPAFILRSSKLADHGAKVWTVVAMWVLRVFFKVEYEIIGQDKIPKESCIIACKHQSMWETMIMHIACKRPAYAFKKELLKIPFYGWYLTVMTGIKVDRKGGISSIKDLIKQAKNCLSNGYNVVIFPEGTRVPIDANSKDYPYQPGIAALYQSCSVKVVPAALNSGYFLNKKTLLKNSGKITLEFLDPIDAGLGKKEFMNKLESSIEKKSNQLLKQARATK